MSTFNTVILAAILEVGRQTAELIDMQNELGQQLEPPVPPTVSTQLTGPVLEVVEAVVRGLRDGTSLDHVKADVKRLTANQEQWAELHGQLMFAHNVARQVDAAKARDKIEATLIAGVNSGRLTTMEQIEALHVLNLHLRAPRAVFLPGGKRDGQWHSTAAWAEAYWLAAQKRQGQALEARLAVEALFDGEPSAQIVVCGDLNADAYEMPTRILQALPEDMETQAHAARALVPLERQVPETARYSVLHDGRHVLLDHILASRQLADRCCLVEILNHDLMDEARANDPVAGSLHAPVVAVFEDPK